MGMNRKRTVFWRGKGRRKRDEWRGLPVGEGRDGWREGEGDRGRKGGSRGMELREVAKWGMRKGIGGRESREGGEEEPAREERNVMWG